MSRLPALAQLSLHECGFGSEGAAALAALTGSTKLDLGLNHAAGDTLAIALAAALTGLEFLGLGEGPLDDNELTDVGASALTRLTQLQHLRLYDVTEEAAEVLCSLSGLTYLAMSGGDRSPWDQRALPGGLTGLAQLQHFDFVHPEQCWTDMDSVVLTTLNQLTSLTLIGCGMGPECADALAKLTRLQDLDVSVQALGFEGAAAIAAALTALTRLRMGCNLCMGDAGANALTSLCQLQELDLYENELAGVGAAALTTLTALTSLCRRQCNP